MAPGGFLPFSDSARETELRAIEVKRRLGIGQYAAVDPYEVLHKLPARLLDASIFDADPSLRDALFGMHREEWSAIGLMRSPATGEELILVNPTHHPHRQKVSLMEEVVHIVLEHPRTELVLPNAAGAKWVRPYNADAEDEAYSVGAACVVPWPELFRAVSKQSESATVIAERYQVSTKYVDYRIRRAGLDRVYKARQRAVMK